MSFMLILVGLLAVVNPLGALPIFLSMTNKNDPEADNRTIKRAVLAVALILLISAWAGESLLGFFGITINAFRTAGGLLILLMGIAMLHGKQSHVQHHPSEAESVNEKEDISVVPLAIPLMAGPGAISLVILDANKIHSWQGELKLALAIVSVAAIAWLVLMIAEKMRDKLGIIGLNIVTRIMGLILAAIGVQFIADGITHLLPGLA
ncbi:MAG: amino acid transporter [Proteobacteria bacterium]|nr:MAG: amino acid transporter [Pseudomonadota bacterium]